MSKTIEEIRAIVATDQGYDSWEDFLEWEDADDVAYHLAIEYSNQQTQELIEQNTELVDLLKGIVKQIEKGEKIGGYNLLTTSSIEYEYSQKLLTKHNHLKSNTNG